MAGTVDAKRVVEYFDDEQTLEAKLDRLASMILASKYTVFYTGAGMATAAGVGDYRGPSGAWTLRRISELKQKELASRASAEEVDELSKLQKAKENEGMKATKKVPITAAQPTLSHMMQATLIKRGLAHFVVTTNLDGIYRKAGLQAHDEVCFLHGDMYTERCTGCGYDFERNWHVRDFERHVHDHHVGTCSRCGSKPPDTYTGELLHDDCPTGADSRGFRDNHLVGTQDKNVGTKDTHINFGEHLDDIDLDEAEHHCKKADLCIVMGTSMSLRHITHLPFKAKKTVIVNLQATPDDQKRGLKLRIWAKCDPVSAGLLSRLDLQPLPVPPWRPRDALPLNQIPAYVSPVYRLAAKLLYLRAKKQTEKSQERIQIEESQRSNEQGEASEKAAASMLDKACPQGIHSGNTRDGRSSCSAEAEGDAQPQITLAAGRPELVTPGPNEAKAALLRLQQCASDDFLETHALKGLVRNRLTKIKYGRFKHIFSDFQATASDADLQKYQTMADMCA